MLCASVSNPEFVPNISYKNEFDLHENEPVGGNISIGMVSHEDLF